MQISTIGENSLIKSFKKIFRTDDKSVICSIGDDTAVIDYSKDEYLLFTTDMLVEGTHFDLKYYTPFQIGCKSMVANISDIAVMGGIPKYALFSVGFKQSEKVAFVDDLCKGLSRVAKQHGVSIIGGDTVKSNKNTVINIALIGTVAKTQLLLRSGAKIGDKLMVTGTLGDSVLGLKILKDKFVQARSTHVKHGTCDCRIVRAFNNMGNYLISNHLEPKPRIAEARTLAMFKLASSLMDLSDGLSQDLYKLANASDVGFKIFPSFIPISKSAQDFCTTNKISAVNYALEGGEDFELLFTAPEKNISKIVEEIENKIGTPVTIIGETVGKKCGIIYETESKRGTKETKSLKEKGYKHF